MVMENKLITYPVPNGADLNQKYTVKVRAKGCDEWTVIPCYTVKVDMHEVRTASMVYFDFKGSIEIEISMQIMEIYNVDIRPLSKNIVAQCKKSSVSFRLDEPTNLSIEVNKDRFHNLHLFAGEAGQIHCDNLKHNVLKLEGNLINPTVLRTKDIIRTLTQMPKNRTLYFQPGIYYFEECCMEIPSDTNIYLAGGSIIKGGFLCDDVQNITIYGRGIVYQACFERFHGIRGVRISHGRNITIEGITFINPPHYTIYVGGAKDIIIRDVKTFSCEGWSDGFDIMSSENIHISQCFLRTSDDCIAIYGRRWDYNGTSRNILVENSVLWADVAHPTVIGTHGDYENDGNILEDIEFKNIDILEHHEIQEGYLGCLAINVGDKNIVRNIHYEDIRIEPFEHGKVFDFQVKCNPDYNPEPGRGILNVTIKNVTYYGHNPVPSCIRGYGQNHMVRGITIENLVIGGRKIMSLVDEELNVAEFAEGIEFR